jgi:hypothetical protein
MCFCGIVNKSVFGQTDKKSNEKLAVAYELFQVMQTEKTLDSATKQMTDLIIQQNQLYAPYRKTIQEFYSKYLRWESLKDDIANIYTEELSLKELNDLVAFYKTPTGQKAIQVFPHLRDKIMELEKQQIQEHVQEFKAMLSAEAEKYKNEK